MKPAFATEIRRPFDWLLSGRAGHARPLHSALVGARHASPRARGYPPLGPSPILAVVWLSCWMPLGAQVSFDRLLHAGQEPQNWLTYSGSYKSWRYSPLDQIRTANAGNLELKWVYQ